MPCCFRIVPNTFEGSNNHVEILLGFGQLQTVLAPRDLGLRKKPREAVDLDVLGCNGFEALVELKL